MFGERTSRVVWTFASIVMFLPFPDTMARAGGVDPACLVGRDINIYRFNAAGNDLMEEFENPSLEMIVGMTRVPPGISVSQCNAGDIIAIGVGSDSIKRVWRVDNASCGTPTLVEIGQISHGMASLAFAHGQLFGIASGGVVREFDPLTFQAMGPAIDVSPNPGTGTGGLAFDDVNTWYALGQLEPGIDRLFQFGDPPSEGGLMEVGDPGFGIGDCGLEYFAGELWGGFRGPGGNLHVGTFDVQTGAFTPVWVRSQEGTQTLGIVMLPARSIVDGDMNCDGILDGLDLAPFVLALTNPIAFETSHQLCNRLNGDLSYDCIVNEDDVPLFVNALLQS